MSKVSSFIDSLQFSIGRSKKKDFTFSEIKERREAVIQNYTRNDQFYQSYIQKDPTDVPGIIFCIDDVLDKYKSLPGFSAILTNFNSDERRAWLQSIPDKGELYKSVYQRLFEESHIKLLEKDKKEAIINLEKLISVDLKDIKNELAEYKNVKLRSKKIKERYHSTMSQLDKLISTTNLPLDKYLSCLFDMSIYSKIQPPTTSEGIVFEEYLEKLTKIKLEIEREQKYIKNILLRTKETLYNRIKEVEELTHPHATQTGKYFKKWSLLTDEEKEDRIFSWVHYYIYKHFLLGKVISTNEEMEDLIEKLKTLLTKEKISYRYIKWDWKNGIITKINCISYNDADKSFKTTCSDDTHTETTTSKSHVVSKIKTNDKLVNDILLRSILLQKSEDECIEQIKSKLHLKKLTAKEKNIISQKYKDITLVVQF